jgi:hypothetical protein
MVKSQKRTRKVRSGSKSSIMSIPQLRKAFDHMDRVVENLRKTAKHSFSDAVVIYREEWRKTFKRDLSPADAAAYLKFRFGMKSSKTRRSRTRGGAMAGPLGGAPLDYQMRAGSTGAYGNFPTYQQQGLDRYYASSLSADCGKANGFPTDGSGASQAGGAAWDALFRPLYSSAPPSMPYQTMMEAKGQTFPSPDPVGQPPYRTAPNSYITTANLNSHIRNFGSDMFKTAATTK